MNQLFLEFTVPLDIQSHFVTMYKQVSNGVRSGYEHPECLTHNWSMYQDQSAQLALVTLVKLVPSIDSSYRST